MCVLELSDVSMYLFNMAEKQKLVDGNPKNLCDYYTYPKNSACKIYARFLLPVQSNCNFPSQCAKVKTFTNLKTWVSIEKRKILLTYKCMFQF